MYHNAISTIIDDVANEFLRNINQLVENGPYRKARRVPTPFSMFQLANSEFYEYAYFERAMECLVRDLLITPAICGLFKIRNINCALPEKGKYVFFRTESLEESFPYEFIIPGEQRIGVRYTSLCANEAEKLIQEGDVDQIIQISWSGVASSGDTIQPGFEVSSPEAFFNRFFTLDEYKVFMDKTTKAIATANSDIGFETIPRLSLRNLSNFKRNISNELASRKYETIRFQLMPGEADPFKLADATFDASDYAELNRNFKQNGLYRALVGTEGFAKCFVTAEYQYHVFGAGQQFDYTAVVCGYLKAVEQLIYKLLLINLDYPSGDTTWIKKNSGKMPDDIFRDRNVVRKEGTTYKIVFKKEYLEYFYTALEAMRRLLESNTKGWLVSDDARKKIMAFLSTYIKDCRNDHFHKDNIDEYDVVTRIRSNTILIAYLLLGGYKLTDSLSHDTLALGIIDGDFDRFYRKVQEIPRGMYRFILYYSDKTPIKAFRHYEQDSTIYDEFGSVNESTIRFVETRDFSWDEYERAMQGLSPDKEFLVSFDNMPTQVSYINGRNEEIVLSW